jgi:hypothetical protein
MTIDTKNASKAPKYRYFTVDLLTNKILAEIPFHGVSYSLALKSAGEFTGKIPVLPTAASRSLDLYQSTMTGQTGLYVLRDNVCVWGGIIWQREYSVEERVLEVSASEFTSYFHHRKIWKTYNYQYGATVSSGERTKVTFDYGSANVVGIGSSVKLEFYDPKDFRFNGYYKVAGSPVPTKDTFYIDDAQSTAKVLSLSRKADIVTVTTEGNHGFSSGDSVTLDVSGVSGLNNTYNIVADLGSASTTFTFFHSGADFATKTVAGEATRPLAPGTYADVTVSVHTDTYDYVRAMVQAVFEDFSGINFPNEYIEPGVSYRVDVINRELRNGRAILDTKEKHKLSIGQSVRVQDVGDAYDGQYTITDVPLPTQIVYARGGTEGSTPVRVLKSTVIARSASEREATIVTSTPHGFLAGQRVLVDAGIDVDGQEGVFNGNQIITSVPSPTSFKFAVLIPSSIPRTNLEQPRAVVNGVTRNIVRRELSNNTVSLNTSEAHGYRVGDIVTVFNVNHVVPIEEMAFNSPQSRADVTAAVNHNLQTNDTVVLSGSRDSTNITRKQTRDSKVELWTNPPHNFRKGLQITIKDMVDVYSPTKYKIENGKVTITFPTDTGIDPGYSVTVANVNDFFKVTQRKLTENVATYYTSVPHGLSPNAKISVAGDVDLVRISSKEATDGVAMITTAYPHNSKQGDEITVEYVGAPFDGKYKVLSATATRIYYEIENKSKITATRSDGVVTALQSIFNGDHVIQTAQGSEFTVLIDGNNVGLGPAADTAMSAVSVINGTYTVTNITRNTISFVVPGAPNRSDFNVVYPEKKEDKNAPQEPNPVVTNTSIHNGVRTIVDVSRETFSFTQQNPRSMTWVDATGTADAESIFNGTYAITGTDLRRFSFTKVAQNNVVETAAASRSFAKATSIFNGIFTITAVDPISNRFSYRRDHRDIPAVATSGFGSAVVQPSTIASTYGPFPGNANIGIDFSTKSYSGVNVDPATYRSFELTNVGEALDSYSDTINGFEYRIDCAYDAENDVFSRTFVLIPINFPDAPTDGKASPVSRFGADKLTFEYPGNIIDLSIVEDAENATTRFFAVGDSDLDADAGNPFSVASAEDLLNGVDGRKWPLLDDDENVPDTYDEVVLYSYAQRYLSESRPPVAQVTVTVNGSLQPEVGMYKPGDWCSLIVEDEWVQQRLRSDLEPRDTVLVRKIDSIKVSVPDGTTFPEKVALSLVAEWEVDKRGK